MTRNESTTFLMWEKAQPYLRKDKLYSLRSTIIHSETGWIVQQLGNNLLGPQILNSLTEVGQEQKIGAVSVDWVVHNVLAIFL